MKKNNTWRERKLGEMCNFFTGKKDVNQTDPAGKYAFFSCSPELYFSNDFLYDGDAIIVAGNGSYTGRTSFFSGKFDLYQRAYACVLKSQGFSIKFLYYYMKEFFEKRFARGRRGSSIPYILRGDLEDFPVFVPSLEVQSRIASVLSALDEKIALNKKICAELEAMAKEIYDYWFVQFDFPNDQNRPYKSSGGKMTFNPTLKRPVPANWEVKTINNLCVNFRGVSYNANDLTEKSNSSVLVLRGNNIVGNNLVYDENVAFIPKSFVTTEQQIKKHDIIMTMSSGSKEHIGKCTMFQKDSPHTYGAFLTKFTPNGNCVHFVYLSLISDFFKRKIKNICSGTGINNLTNETFDDVFFAFPDALTLEKFEKKLTPIYEKIGVLNDENEELKSLRDFLLSLLMNGQVEVK